MQLSIRATGNNASMISHLLAKNPNNVYERKHKGHLVRLFYQECSEQTIDVTIFVTPDPLELVKHSSRAYDITHYINDREFAVSSIFCSFIRSALGTALNGQPKDEYKEWVDHVLPFEFNFGPVASSLSDKQIIELFEPLGFETDISYGETDYSFQMKQASSARWISLTGNTTLQQGLRQLFVLIPVLDQYKHYYIDQVEIEKLERYGEGWLEQHPLKEFIWRQALIFKEVYKLVDNNIEEIHDADQQKQQAPRLNELRYDTIIEQIKTVEQRASIVDFGSGEGKLSTRLGFLPGVKEILAVEPSEMATLRALDRYEKAAKHSGFTSPTPVWGSLFYFDERLKAKDIMILCEVIEHINEERLPKIMEMIFREYKPKTLIITTPNKEYNELYKLNDHFRHTDHRFEWTRAEFDAWCEERSISYPYERAFVGIGEPNEQYGCPTQMCIFTRTEV
ncbi:3' terminal RNA ribose 2'-O-methyltransferase Hen1 [Bacillus sp. Hm123]|uniref:3' terminal RNA ribose 2'-O-methyltransferase Hen1 n=1 Tax=Bacillus sp. Hm123 TaxID=3450745 RepID=UPI003F42B80A